jgi:hypothetical protein
MFEIYVSTMYNKLEVQKLLEEYLYSEYSDLPENVIHSITVAFPTVIKKSYIVILNIDPVLVPEFYEKLCLGVTICPNLVCQHTNVY